MSKKFVIHAGHAPSGGIGCGTVSLLNESDEARHVVEYVKEIMKTVEAELVDVTVKENKIAKTVLTMINQAVTKEKDCDLAISIHLNASENRTGTGTEVFCWNGENGKSAVLSARMSAAISNALGIRDRGVKNGNHLSVIKNVTVPSILIECCFCDNTYDCDRWSAYNTARAIVDVLKDYYSLDIKDSYDAGTFEPEESASNILYRVQVGAFSNKKNAENMAQLLSNAGFDSYIYKEDK